MLDPRIITCFLYKLSDCQYSVPEVVNLEQDLNETMGDHTGRNLISLTI